MPGRSFSSPAYRYGFNGKEKTDEINGDGNAYDYDARIYDCRQGRWLSLDPLQSKYPSLSPYHSFANNPIRFIDPNGKEIIDPQGKHVSVIRSKNGTLSFSSNATPSIIRVANALNLTEEGRNSLRQVVRSDIKVKINIVTEVKITEMENGKTKFQFGGTIQGNMNESDNYGKKVNPDGTYGIKNASITIYEGTLSESIKPASGLEHEGLNKEQAIAAVAGHEIVHATDKVEINRDLKYEQTNKGKQRPASQREAKPEQVETKIINQSKDLDK